jgi:hypothetical protein
MRKNDAFGTIDERKFGLLKIVRTSYPNDQHLFEFRPAAATDERESVADWIEDVQ